MAKPLDGRPRKRPRPCQVCTHSERQRIESLRAAGISLDKLAEQFGVSRDSIHRHWSRHVSDFKKASYLCGPARIEELANRAAEENRSLIDYYAILRSALFFQFDKLAEKGDHVGVSMIAARINETLKAIGKATGAVSDLAAKTSITINNNVAILNSEPFTALQGELLALCQRHPEIRADVVTMLKRLDDRFTQPTPSMIESRPMVCEPVEGSHHAA